MTDYIFDLIRMMIGGVPVYLLFRYVQLRRRAARLSTRNGTRVTLKFNRLRECCLCLFVVFMIALLAFVWQGEYGAARSMLEHARERIRTGDGINLIPFRTIRSYYHAFGFRGDLFCINILGNIFMFMPWGFFLMFLWKRNRNLWRLLFFSVMLPVLIECSQLFINRQVDTDDVILNFAGGMLGGALYFLLAGIFPKIKDIAL